MATTRNRQVCPQDSCRSCSEETRGCLQEFGEATSLHGVQFITGQRGHLCERLCWTVVLIASAVLCCREITKLYARWQDSPVITSFARHSTLVSTLPFPAVTICPESKVIRSVMDVEEKFDWLRSRLNGTTAYHNETERLLVETISIVCESDPDLRTDFPQRKEHSLFIPKVSPRLEDVFEKCMFGMEEYDCSKLFRPIIADEGLCFTFNMLSPKDIFNEYYDGVELGDSQVNDTSWSLEHGYTNLDETQYEYPWREKIHLGPMSGLEIYLKSRYGTSQPICSATSSDNFKVTLHSPVEFPLPCINYFYVSPSTETMVSVLPERIETDADLFPPNYGPKPRACFFPQETKGILFRNLTQHNCLLDIKIKMAKEKCNCTFHDTPVRGSNNESLSYCNYNTCIVPVEVVKSCLPSCYDLKYRYHVSSSKFEWVKKSRDVETKDYQYTKIIVYFESQTFFAIRKSQLYGVTDFIANCGGLLGLFTGFSVITVMEIFYFASLRLACRLRERRSGEQH